MVVGECVMGECVTGEYEIGNAEQMNTKWMNEKRAIGRRKLKESAVDSNNSGQSGVRSVQYSGQGGVPAP